MIFEGSEYLTNAQQGLDIIIFRFEISVFCKLTLFVFPLSITTIFNTLQTSCNSIMIDKPGKCHLCNTPTRPASRPNLRLLKNAYAHMLRYFLLFKPDG